MNLNNLQTTVHLSVSTVYALAAFYTIYLGLNIPNEYFIHEIVYMGRYYFWYFLCSWIGMVHHFYFALYSTIDIISMITPTKFLIGLTKDLHQLGTFLLYSLIFPYAFVITPLFWTLYFFNSEKMYSEVMCEVIPFFLQHFMHTFPLPLSLLYMTMTSDVNPPPKVYSFPTLLIFSSVYNFVFIRYRLIVGKWIYLIFDVTTPLQTVIILSYALFGPYIFYFVGYKLHPIIKDIKNNYMKSVKCD